MKNRKMGEERRTTKHENVRALEAVVVAPGRRPRVTIIADTLAGLQSIVGGYIEVVDFTPENIIVCNEEGRMLGLPENRMGICGTFIVLGRGKNGRFGSVVDPCRVVEHMRTDEDAYAG